MATSCDLINIIDVFTLPESFTTEEEIELVQTAYSLIEDLLDTEPMLYIQPYFHEYVIMEVLELMLSQLSQIINYDIEDEVTICIEQAMKVFYTQVAPKRSYNTSFILAENNHMQLKEQINYLQSIPQPDQRTAEWYKYRYRFLTASSIWKAFISDSTRNQLIYDKCKPLNIDKYSRTSTDSPMHWGNKYEPVSVQLYEEIYKTVVSDFGCIPHKTLRYLAASPDGINTLETSERYGRMLEIKNIFNRDIDGVPKMEYWIQMQLQMEVCNLNECDFLETRFKEYADEDEYLLDSYQDKDFNKTKTGQQKGMMIQFMVRGQPHYEYAQLNADKQQLTDWEEAMMQKHDNNVWVKNIYWRLDELSCVLVLRNMFWFEHAIPILNELWKTIEYEKVNGYEHRSPNKKLKVGHINLNKPIIVKKCCVDLYTDYAGCNNENTIVTHDIVTHDIVTHDIVTHDIVTHDIVTHDIVVNNANIIINIDTGDIPRQPPYM
jgi:putative phage-type endonuclease